MSKAKCQMCGIECELTKHHLIPQVKCKNKYKEIKNEDSNIIWICRPCHDAIHANFSETELKYSYSTLEELLAAPPLKKFISLRQKHPDFSGSAKMSNKRKNR